MMSRVWLTGLDLLSLKLKNRPLDLDAGHQSQHQSNENENATRRFFRLNLLQSCFDKDLRFS